MQSDYIKHHGIRGQKWGIRRFQNKDGTLTPEGKKHLDRLSSAKKEYKSAKNKVMFNRSFGIYDHDAENKYKYASGKLEFRKQQAKDYQLKQKMADRKDISKREQTLIDKYTKDGMSKEEAELKAYKQAKLEKTLAIAGAVTMTAATAYGLKKYHDYTHDEILKAGNVTMKRVASSDSKDLHDTFYAAFGKTDANKYVGVYGSQLVQQGNKGVFQKSIDITSDLKIASDKKAKQTMADTIRSASKEDKANLLDSLEAYRTAFSGSSKRERLFDNAVKDVKNGKYDTKSVYDALNIAMIDREGPNVINKFKENLKKEGYAGVKDRNDKSYSGYKANTARIIFDNSKVKVKDVRKVGIDEVRNKQQNFYTKEMTKQLAALGAGVYAGNKAINKISSTSTNKSVIKNYKKAHPDSKLTDQEILENYYGGK